VKEPLEIFYEKYGANPGLVKELVCGSRYFAVMFNDGRLGVCATLDSDYNVTINALREPDFGNTSHRILLNAYFNALINTSSRKDFQNGDVFQAVDFRKYSNIVMIGLFRPLLKKFVAAGIDISVFDKTDKEEPVLPDELQTEYIGKADVLIVTATSIFNGTFNELVNRTNSDCDVLVLGPSAVMSPLMFEYKNVKAVFGSVFNVFDDEVLSIIRNGFGTRVFACRAEKQFLLKSECLL